MKKFLFYSLVSILFFSCSHKKQIIYINDVSTGNLDKINSFVKNNIEIGDVLSIKINTAIAEVSLPYNNLDDNAANISRELLIINGYKVDNDSSINYPVLGKISVVGLTVSDLSLKIKKMLINYGHLNNPYVKVSKVNSKFTVIGEVSKPGTFFYYDNRLNIFQAIGTAGDLLITAKRKNVKLVREENGLRKTYKFSLNQKEIFDKPYYYIKSNDVIIIEPNFSKVKSAGFIGSSASLASISSLILSITLLLINN